MTRRDGDQPRWAWSVRYPRVLAATIVTIAVWGCVALVSLPRQEEPVLTWRLANVVTRLPGASPSRVESLITDVLEQHIREVDEVEHLYSVSRAGVSLVQIELSDDVTAAAPVWQKVQQKLTEAAAELPPGVIGPELDDEIMGTFAVLAAVTGSAEHFSFRTLKDHAKRLEDQLRYLPETASTSLFGTQHEVIEVQLDPAKLAAYEISFDQVAAALHGRNARRPGGRLEVDAGELVIEATGELESEHDVAATVLSAGDAARTFLVRDVADVRRTTRTPAQPLARADGRRAIVVGTRARPALRIDLYGDQVHAIIERFRESLPRGVECVVLHDLSRSTRGRTTELSWTLLLSIVLVFGSTSLLMGLRASWAVTAAVPVTGLFVLVLFSLLGVPLNQMSVMAIIMSLGLLVDNAIVVTEQIHRRTTEGADVVEAAANEPAGLFAPLLVATLTTTAAFLPIYLLPGGTGEFVRAIPVGVTVCLLTSLLVAMTVVPWCCTLLFRNHEAGRAGSRLSAARDRLFAAASDRYVRILTGVLARPVVSLAVVGLTLGAIASLGLTLRRDFFSPVQRDQFVIDVVTPQGSALAHTLDVVKQVEALVLRDEAVEHVGSFVGSAAPLVFYNLTSQETYANHYAQIIVDVTDWEQTAAAAMRLQRVLDEQIAGAYCCAHILEHGAPLVAPFEIRIRGPSIETLTELGRRAESILAATGGVRNVRSNYGNEALKLVVEVNEPVARSMGIDAGTVADEMRNRIDGLAATAVQEDDERLDVLVRLRGDATENITDVWAFDLKPHATKRRIPLAQLAGIRPRFSAASIYRRDGERTLTVLAYPEFGLTAAQVAGRFRDSLASFADRAPEGYSVELGGENEQRTEAEGRLLGAAVYSVCVIILLLTGEFRSFRLTALILAVIPLSLAGTMLGLFITGWPLNFMALMGMMMLIGVVVNDAVILIDGYERRRRAGEAAQRVLIDGTVERTRHVVITTVTTIAGFLPLALSPSLLWPPLAIAVIGGLALSTLLTLVAVPAAYGLLMFKEPPTARSGAPAP